MKSRIVVLFIILTGMWSVILIRAAVLQLLPHERLEQLQKRQFKKKISLRSTRGSILDRMGRELAVSVTSYSLYADPQMIENKVSVSRQLARQLKMSHARVKAKINSANTRFVWLKRQMSKEEMQNIKKLGFSGVGFIEEPKRIYPNNHLFSQGLGIAGRDGLGREGIELGLDSYLRGEEKKVVVQRDARGRPVITNSNGIAKPKDGMNVFLTIDSELQYMLETKLVESLLKNEAKSAVGMIVDVESAEILAMANVPTFDVNSPFSYSPIYRKNRSVTDAFEPGSTMKPFVIAAALENGLIKPNSKIDCEGGTFQIGKRVIREADSEHNFKILTASEVLAHSSNIGTTKIAFKVGDKVLKEFLEKFGFGSKPDIRLPGASTGIVNDLPWGDHQLANISFGHGLTASSLQIAAAYTAIANKGIYRPLNIINKIVHPYTGESEDFKGEVGERRVLSEPIAYQMKLMLTSATSKQGTGFNARPQGFLVAGKTGTAQKVDFQKGGYIKGEYISSFAGFVPTHNPKFVIYIAVDNPKKSYYGAAVAAPIFADVAQYALQRSGVTPMLLSKGDLVGKELFNIKSENFTRPKHSSISKVDLNQVPQIKGLSLRQVLKELGESKKKVKIIGRGYVDSVHPEPGELWADDEVLMIQLKSQ